jgi:hypothetical protein
LQSKVIFKFTKKVGDLNLCSLGCVVKAIALINTQIPDFFFAIKSDLQVHKKVGDLNLCASGCVVKAIALINAQIPDFFSAIKSDLQVHKKSRGSQSLLFRLRSKRSP